MSSGNKQGGKYLRWKTTYDKYPETRILGYDKQAFAGWESIKLAINRAMTDNRVLVVDCYPGVDDAEVLENLGQGFEHIINMEDIFCDGETITEIMQSHLTCDRVRGVMYYGDIFDFIDNAKLNAARRLAETRKGRLLIYGFGAALVSRGDVFVYADLARWEIQQRYRRGMTNYKQKNHNEDVLRKYKRGYFVEWRIADKHKAAVLRDIDFYLDTNTAPRMATATAYFFALDTLTQQPFRLVPYFEGYGAGSG